MSNRLLWILILLWFVLFWIAFYMYFFVYYNATIVINSNVKEYKVELYTSKLLKTFNFDCPENRCVLRNISPFPYNFRIIKEWYNDFRRDIKVWRSDIIEMEVNLRKKVSLEKTKEVKQEQKLSNKEKIEELRKAKSYYATFKLDNGKNFYFTEKSWKLTLSYLENNIASFDIVDKEDIFIKEVYWDDNSIFLQLWSKKYLYNLTSNFLQEIDLNIELDYIKYWNNNYIFVTSKGSFVYDIRTNNLEYFSLFKDFIYFEDYYVWFVKTTEERILKNLWFEGKNGNIVISYNPFNKEKKIIYETSVDFSKIINRNWNILLINNNGEEYVLENF